MRHEAITVQQPSRSDFVQEGLCELSFYLAKNEFDDSDILWIYKKGEKDVLTECIKHSEQLLQEGRYRRIILITDDQELDYKNLDHYFKIEKCTDKTIYSLIMWYMLGHPNKNFFVISLEYPDGRNGKKWIQRNYTLSDICKHGVLRIVDK